MKTKLIALLLLLTLAGQAMSMGHPHNVFAARKQIKAKTEQVATKARPSVGSSSLFARIDTIEFARRLVRALAALRPAT